MINTLRWSGSFEIFINGQQLAIVQNRLTDAGLNALVGNLKTASDITIKYLALGDSDMPLSDSMTALGNERFRTPFYLQESGGTGIMKSYFSVLDAEANFHIKEVGIFIGNATTAKDSGIMLSRILWSHDKLATEELQFVRTDKIMR